MADLAERLDQIIGRVAIVLNNEKAHDVLPWSGSHPGSGSLPGSRSLAGSGSLAGRRPASNHIVCQPLWAISIQNVNQNPERRSADPLCGRKYCIIGAVNSEGVASSARHPLYPLHRGGGDMCREAELVFGGDGPCGPSPGYARQRGRRMPAVAPSLRRCQAARLRTWCPGSTSPGIRQRACPPCAHQKDFCGRRPVSTPSCRPHRE